MPSARCCCGWAGWTRHLDAALGIALEVEDPYEQELARGQRNRQNG
jgi:hypothetical protein